MIGRPPIGKRAMTNAERQRRHRSGSVEVRQSKLQVNADAIERWMRKLLRAAHELEKLRAQRKRLLGPKRPTEVRYRSLDDIRMACGGAEFNDELPG